MSETRRTLFKEIVPPALTPHGKVTVVGVGQVGMACAYSILQQVDLLIIGQFTISIIYSLMPINNLLSDAVD